MSSISTPDCVQLTIDNVKEYRRYPASLSLSTNSKPQKPGYAPLKMKSPSQQVVPRFRRPFKYLKHQGPRPVPLGISALKITPRHFLAGDKVLDCKSHQRSTLSSKSPVRGSVADGNLATTLRINDKPYSETSSRLLRSRNLNLTALDISVCKLKRPPVEVLYDEPDSLINSASKSSGRPMTARHSRVLSCFSDWSTTTSATQMRSHSFTAASNVHTGTHSSFPGESSSMPGEQEGRPLRSRQNSTTNLRSPTKKNYPFGLTS